MVSGPGDTGWDYDGAIVVVELTPDEVVLVHPGSPTVEGPASLPGDPCRPGSDPRDEAVRIVAEQTGLQVRVERELTTFVQEGTPTGTMLAHGYVAQPVGGLLLEQGPAGAVGVHPVSALPEFVAVRVAIQRVRDAYLGSR